MARPLSQKELERQNVSSARFTGTSKTQPNPTVSYRAGGTVTWDTAESPRPTVSSRFNEERAQNTGISTQPKNSDVDQTTDITNTQIEREPYQPRISQELSTTPAQETFDEVDDADFDNDEVFTPTNRPGVGKRVIKTTTRVARRTAAKPVFIVMASIHFWIWITIQLTLVMVSLAFLAVDGALDNTWIGYGVKKVAEAVAAVTKWVGTDISSLNPKGFFLLLHSLTTQLMWGIVLITVFSYFLMQFKAMSGRATGLKMITILAAIAGYAFPVANLLPWIFLYLLVMLKYPD